MGVSFNNRKARKKYRTEKRGTDLAHTATNTFNGASAINDERFCKSIFKAYVPSTLPIENVSPGATRNQITRGGNNILYALAGAISKWFRLMVVMPRSRSSRIQQWLSFFNGKSNCMFTS
jgi:hypothetical protein